MSDHASIPNAPGDNKVQDSNTHIAVYDPAKDKVRDYTLCTQELY